MHYILENCLNYNDKKNILKYLNSIEDELYLNMNIPVYYDKLKDIKNKNYYKIIKSNDLYKDILKCSETINYFTIDKNLNSIKYDNFYKSLCLLNTNLNIKESLNKVKTLGIWINKKYYNHNLHEEDGSYINFEDENYIQIIYTIQDKNIETILNKIFIYLFDRSVSKESFEKIYLFTDRYLAISLSKFHCLIGLPIYNNILFKNTKYKEFIFEIKFKKAKEIFYHLIEEDYLKNSTDYDRKFNHLTLKHNAKEIFYINTIYQKDCYFFKEKELINMKVYDNLNSNFSNIKKTNNLNLNCFSTLYSSDFIDYPFTNSLLNNIIDITGEIVKYIYC